MAPKSPAVTPRRSARASTPTRAKSPISQSSSTPNIISSTLKPPSTSSTTSATRKSTRAASPKPRSSSTTTTKSPSSTNNNTRRPELPFADKNELLSQSKDSATTKSKSHKVKTQTLHLGPPTEDTIVIARVKCPVPKGVPGHLIKRFDTNAVSASSLFRAAFPTASTAAENNEMKWIASQKAKFGDTRAAGREHDETHRLSGTWIPAEKAHALAEEYGLTKYASALIEFERASEPASTGENQDSEADSPAVRSPRSKRARVASPNASAVSPTPKSALSGASSNGVSILQTLSTDAATGVTTETTEVKVDVPVSSTSGHEGRGASSNGLVASDELVAEQIAQAKQLVEDLKASGTLAQLTDQTTIPVSGKRVHEDDDDELPQFGTMADAIDLDQRGFFGRIFRRKQGRRVPVNAGREIRPTPGGGALVIHREEVEGRRWAAGFGLALAVGATAAAPYLFG